MGKLLGLDVGEKRIGYAVSDESLSIAFPRGFLKRESWQQVLKNLQAVIQEENISDIIVGLPLNEENEEGKEAKNIRAFAEKIGGTLGLPVDFIDEHGTTKEALAKIPTR
ncbi:Holliday junction resolvase RuvX, partial [Candidatus Peregrinibacteria bacterium]|nr:Holliday junction resolvase RuvX [Candidatus Peregrinibacteria bacterium]